MWGKNKVLGVSVGVLLVLALYVYLNSPLIVTVTGNGEVEVQADQASVSFTVTANDVSPVVAVNSLQAKADALAGVLIQYGMKENEIVRTQPQVVPASLVVATATGYQASLSMGGKTDQVNEIANISAVLYEKGATLVSQPTLAVKEVKLYEEKALKEALADANAQAIKLQWKQLKLFKRAASISQSETASTGTVSTKTTPEEFGGVSDTLTISKSVSVTYRLW